MADNATTTTMEVDMSSMMDGMSGMSDAMDQMANMTATIVDLQAQIDDMMASIDLFFVLTMGIVCFLMQAGFGLLEVGSIRAKNASNIMLKNLMDASVAAIAYYLFGYSVAYGAGGNGFIGGSSLLALRGDQISTVDYIYWFFNYVFAGTTATIVSGAVAERCQFRAYLVYSFALAGFIYPVCSHWIWDPNGFLNGKVYDFAGGGAVHMVGGVAAATAAFILGPRTGKFVIDGETGKKVAVNIPGHNVTLAVLGTLILWFGFFAFNGGSSYTIAGEAQYNATGRAVVVTTLGGAFGGVVTMIWGFLATKSWDIGWVINGLLGGMVATCSGANALEPWAGIIVGVLGSIATQSQVLLFEHVLFIDDPLNASAVHLGAGAVGMVFVAFMANPEFAGEEFTGIFYGGEWKFLGYQFMGMAAYTGWTLGTSGAMFFALKSIGWFRVHEEEERVGVDKSHHGGSAYPVDDEHEEKQSLTGADSIASKRESPEPSEHMEINNEVAA
ncbi:Ammonium transporter 1 member [Seminavis robusta]|uniref:Ammonium transporter n=1 Tax=Seminavis robusta TaxID=568900 RepID=A0A9N8EP96_9STRA|nr:Ammonium transporter 1 member [Seminavis robusta]|eukprot:Sro1521_g279450.1 Ammonium transporter 1 member (500) ;mRNA; f:4004-5701